MVECTFNIPQNADYGPEQDQNPYPGNQATLGTLKHGIGENGYIINDFLMAIKTFVKLTFQGFLKPKPFGNTKSHGQNRNNGQK